LPPFFLTVIVNRVDESVDFDPCTLPAPPRLSAPLCQPFCPSPSFFRTRPPSNLPRPTKLKSDARNCHPRLVRGPHRPETTPGLASYSSPTSPSLLPPPYPSPHPSFLAFPLASTPGKRPSTSARRRRRPVAPPMTPPCSPCPPRPLPPTQDPWQANAAPRPPLPCPSFPGQISSLRVPFQTAPASSQPKSTADPSQFPTRPLLEDRRTTIVSSPTWHSQIPTGCPPEDCYGRVSNRSSLHRYPSQPLPTPSSGPLH